MRYSSCMSQVVRSLSIGGASSTDHNADPGTAADDPRNGKEKVTQPSIDGTGRGRPATEPTFPR